MQTYRYKNYGEITVLKTSGTLSQIRTDNDVEFWVSTDKLKKIRQKRESTNVSDERIHLEDLRELMPLVDAVIVSRHSISITTHPDSVDNMRYELELYTGRSFDPDSFIYRFESTGNSYAVDFDRSLEYLVPKRAHMHFFTRRIHMSSKLLVFELLKRGLKLSKEKLTKAATV